MLKPHFVLPNWELHVAPVFITNWILRRCILPFLMRYLDQPTTKAIALTTFKNLPLCSYA